MNTTTDTEEPIKDMELHNSIKHLLFEWDGGNAPIAVVEQYKQLDERAKALTELFRNWDKSRTEQSDATDWLVNEMNENQQNLFRNMVNHGDDSLTHFMELHVPSDFYDERIKYLDTEKWCAVGDYGIEIVCDTEKECQEWIDDTYRQEKLEGTYTDDYYQIQKFTQRELDAMPED